MHYQDLEGKSLKELQGLVAEDRAKLYALRMKRSVNQVKDVRELREIRQHIARLLTKIQALNRLTSST